MQHIFDFSAETHFVGDPNLVLMSGGDLRQVDLERFVAVYYPVATETNTTPLGSLMHMFITSILKECYPPAEYAEARPGHVCHNMVLDDDTHWCVGYAHCGHCGLHSDRLLFCSRCKMAGYCNAACQKAAWPAHKRECKSS